MTREDNIVETFVELAGTLVDEFDALDFLHRLVGRCVELLDCAEAGVLLANPAGQLLVMASSSERADALEVLQSENSEGPCFECYQGGRPVVSHDLGEDAARWPTFAPAALDRGFRSVQTVPMRVRGDTIGAMNLFRAGTGVIADRDLSLAQGMADIAAVALLQERILRESQDIVDQLQSALTSRVVIEQAKGVVAQHAQVTVDAAFARMRDYARRNNRRLSEVASDVVTGRLAPTELVKDPSQP